MGLIEGFFIREGGSSVSFIQFVDDSLFLLRVGGPQNFEVHSPYGRGYYRFEGKLG